MTNSRLALSGVLVLAALLLSFDGQAQQAGTLPRIAFLSTTSSPDSPTTVAFRQGLRELGYVEGQNLVIEWRWGGGTTERFPQLAAEVVGLDVNVIVAANDAAGHAVQQSTKTIPVVIAVMGDPVASGFAATLGRPGGNITGLTMLSTDLAAKRVQLLKEAMPDASRVAVLVDTNDRSYGEQVRQTQLAARTLGVRLRLHEVSKPGQLDRAFAAMGRERAEAVLIIGGTMLYANRAQLAKVAMKSRLPVMCAGRVSADDGCLMSYSTSLTDQFRRAAYIVDKILKGARPAELPIEQPTTFELVVNLKTAKALGLTIPESLLQRADEVIR